MSHEIDERTEAVEAVEGRVDASRCVVMVVGSNLIRDRLRDIVDQVTTAILK